MKDRCTPKYGLIVLLLLASSVLPSKGQAGNIGSKDKPESEWVASLAQLSSPSASKLAGAYFFYWWLFPDDPDAIDPYDHIAFHPPGLLPSGAYPPCFHAAPWCIGYQVGDYNTTYYNVNQQRWWEWQFRDMVEAGLDIAFLDSWDGESLAGRPYFFNPNKMITAVDDDLVPALDNLGNPIKIALFDDTASEHHQWCADVFDGEQKQECMATPALYLMPLDGTVGNGHGTREYFLRKMLMFYGAIPQDKWATHNGLPIDQGGRPLLLMWKAEGLFTNLNVGGHSYALDLMCEIKGAFHDEYQVEPFLLPNSNWYYLDNQVNFQAVCPDTGFRAIDGFSAFGAADGTFGAVLYPNDVNGYTTAYLGPGRDDCAYSGPFGTVATPPECPLTTYNARWWDIGRNEVTTDRQDLYYKKSWEQVAAWEQQHSPHHANLIVVESWNELKEGSAIARLDDYIGPDLMLCDKPYAPPNCTHPVIFTEDPQGPSGGVWVPRYWMQNTRTRVANWKESLPGEAIFVDNDNEAACPDPRGGDCLVDYGDWIRGVFADQYCQDAYFIVRYPEGASGKLTWQPWPALPPGVYDAYAWWQKDVAGTQDAPFGIYGEADSLVHIDQSRSQDAGRWNYLGTFPFAAGSGVDLTNVVEHPQGSVVLADAIRLVYREPYASPPPLAHRRYLPLVMRNDAAGKAGGPPLPTPLPGGYPPPPTGTPLPTPTEGGYPPPPTQSPPPSPTASPTPTPPPGDEEPPESSVDPLPEYHNDPVGLWASWSGTDPGGSGIYLYDVQYKDGAGAWIDWLPRTSYSGWWFHLVEDGHTYAFRCRAEDRAGNMEGWPANPDHDTYTTVDLTPPSSAVSALPPYSGASFTVSWTGWDATSGVDSYDVQVCLDDCADPAVGWTGWITATTQTAASFVEGQDGHSYYFRSRARDLAGNVEPWPDQSDASTMVDAFPPTSEVAALPEYSDNPVLVSWSGQDGASGVAYYDVQVCWVDCILPKEAVWTDWITQTTVTQALFDGEDGPAYFRCRARDHAGNQEAYPGYADAWTIIDSGPPASAVDELPAFSGPSFTVSWSGWDAGSGIESYDVQVCVGGICPDPTAGIGPTWMDWITGTTATSATFVGGENGLIYNFRSRARDHAGNVEPWPPVADASTIIDAVPPSSQVDDLPRYSMATFTVTWGGADDASGIASYDVQYCLENCADPLVPWSHWLQGITQTAAGFAAKDAAAIFFRSRARDHAGNVELWPAIPDTSTTVDLNPPASQVGALPPYSRDAFTVTWSGADDASGVASFDLQVCQGDCFSPESPWAGWLTETSALSATFAGGEDGASYYFRSRARDQVGNREAWPVEPDAWTTVDLAPPSSSVEPLPDYSPATFTVTWAGQDSGSGLAGYDLQVCASAQPTPDCWQDWITGTLTTAASFSGTHGQSYAFRCRAWDALGNTEPYSPSFDTRTQVDAQGPQTWMDPPLSLGDPGPFLMRWQGQDRPAGIATYDLYLRDEAENDWMLWLEEVTATEAVFTGTAGHTYHFCVRGVDHLGNVEDKACPGAPGDWPIFSEASVALPPTSRVEELPPLAPGNPFEVHWSGSPDVAAYDVQVMDLAKGIWKDWLLGTAASSAWFTGEFGHTYAFRCRAVDPTGSVPLEPWPWGYDAHTTIPLPDVDGIGLSNEDDLDPRRQRLPEVSLPTTHVWAGRRELGVL